MFASHARHLLVALSLAGLAALGPAVWAADDASTPPSTTPPPAGDTTPPPAPAPKKGKGVKVAWADLPQAVQDAIKAADGGTPVDYAMKLTRKDTVVYKVKNPGSGKKVLWFDEDGTPVKGK
jgi:hypothetical protein